MSIFKSPSDYPWPFAVLCIVGGIGLGAYSLNLDLVPHTWSVPLEGELKIADGQFIPYKPGNKAPYIFQTDGGGRINLGCLPESAMAACLQDAGIPLNYLAQKRARIGYFYVQNWSVPSLSNVLTTLSVDDRQLLTFPNSRQKMMTWSVTEERIKHSFFALLFPIGSVGFGVWLAIAKMKLNDR
jgi:hypothetical protein